jgi:universal stress protein A
MFAPKKILVPTDFSECAAAAVDYAKGLAEKVGGTLTLLHTYLPMAMAGGDGTMLPDIDAELAQEAQTQMLALRAELEAAGVLVEQRVVRGPSAETIAQVARAGGFDLIVMGTHGRTGLRHLLLGSVAERVVRLASCPVLTVRATPEPQWRDTTSSRP